MTWGDDGVRQSSFPLRLASSLQKEARKTAELEGVSLNQLINLAVAEKISALRTEEFFRERGAHSIFANARKLLQRAGNEPPRDGDELP
jgi:hypothetical protein